MSNTGRNGPVGQPRISRDQMFMEIAMTVSKRGTCDRANVGAVLVSQGRVVSIGYNGSKPGAPHCDDVGHDIVNGHCVRTVHAEVNCLRFYQDNRHVQDSHQSPLTLYVTHFPCINCCKEILTHNLKVGSHSQKVAKVVYGFSYRVEEGDIRFELLKLGGVEIVRYSNCEGHDNSE